MGYRRGRGNSGGSKMKRIRMTRNLKMKATWDRIRVTMYIDLDDN